MTVGFIPSRQVCNLPKTIVKNYGLPIIIHTMKRATLSKKLDDLHVCTNSRNSRFSRGLWWKIHYDIFKT